jgi:cytolethal distending toxin subunit A
MLLTAAPIDASRAADGTRLLINGKTGQCLTIAGGTSPANNLAAVQFDCDGDLSRSWHLNSAGGTFQIQNAKTGKCLTIAGGTSPANNLEAVQFDCDSDPSRTWRLKD